MDFEYLLQLILNGLFVGSFYGLVALGYSMVYGIIKLLNFAHGDIYMLGAFSGYTLLTIGAGVIGGQASIVVLVVISRDRRVLQNNLPASLGKPFLPWPS